MLQSDTTALMQQSSPRMSNWVSLQQADKQTSANETESKSQTLNNTIILKYYHTIIKSSETNLSFHCWCCTLSCRGLILKLADNE